MTIEKCTNSLHELSSGFFRKTLTYPLETSLYNLYKTIQKTEKTFLDFFYSLPSLSFHMASSVLSLFPSLISLVAVPIFNKFSNEYAYTHYGESKQTKKNSFSIITLNCCLMPECINPYNQMEATSKRVENIAKELLELNPDIICLQEVFSLHAEDKLIENLKENYPYFVHDIGPNPFIFGVNSGLFIASKFPLERISFTPFDNLVGDDYFSRKGIIKCDAKISEAHKVTLFNTHLQAGLSSKQAEAKEKQLHLLHQLVKDATEQSFEKNFLVCGDLNYCEYDSKENPYIKDWEKSRFFIDDRTAFTNLLLHNPEKKETCRGTHWINSSRTHWTHKDWEPNREKVAKGCFLDHILLKSAATPSLKCDRVDVPLTFSKNTDHLPVFANITMKSGQQKLDRSSLP